MRSIPCAHSRAARFPAINPRIYNVKSIETFPRLASFVVPNSPFRACAGGAAVATAAAGRRAAAAPPGAGAAGFLGTNAKSSARRRKTGVRTFVLGLQDGLFECRDDHAKN